MKQQSVKQQGAAGQSVPKSAAEQATKLVAEARALLENRRFAEVEQAVRAGLANAAHAEHHVDARYVLAVALRYQDRYADALGELERLLAVEPRHARAHQERGYLLRSLGRADESAAAFREALRNHPALLSSWKALADHCRRIGDNTGLKLAAAEIDWLESLPAELRGVADLLHGGKLYRADRLCRSFLRNNKRHIEGMRLLAAIGERLGVLTDAEFLLETCIELAPDHDRARCDLANLLLRMQKFEPAREQTALLVERQPDNLAFLSLHANALAGVGDQEGAIALYDRVIGRSKGQQVLHVMRGHAQKTIGRLDEAVRSYRQAYRLREDYGDAWWSLANTKTYRFSKQELAQMKRAEADDTVAGEDRIHLCFALGKALEDREEYRESFAYYQRGNDLKRAELRGGSADVAQRTGAQKAVFSRAFVDSREGAGCPAPDPIFILGLPRAGSTLLEQVLASHSMVDGTLELPHVVSLAQRLRGAPRRAAGAESRYPRLLTRLDADYFRRFGEQYIEQTRVYRRGAPFFIDKQPNNFMHIGLIRLMLPNAKVIDARRHPMACCFSGFKQLFGQGQEFSYGLREIGNYYREYVALMDHWDEVLPGFVLRVQHEDVVDDLESGVRRVLDFCGLPFEQACLDYHQTERSIRTPSSEQVRQPIYRSGLDAWRPFEPWLDPLKEALGPAVRARYPID